MTQESKDFYKSLVHVVGPIALQNLISAAVSSADVIMLGYIGQTEIAASSLASQIMFIMLMIATGLGSGLVILCAQYWGKKDIEAIRTLHGIALRISTAAGLIFSIATMFFPQAIMKFFTNEEPIIQSGTIYLKAISLSYLCFSISQVFQAGFKSIERVKIVSIITTTTLSLNILLNAVFIFGLLGLPAMGIKGVGLATTISRVIELIFCLIYAKCTKDVKFSLSNIVRFNSMLNRDFFKYSLPALGNELVWGSAFSAYSVIFGHLGEDLVAANSVVGVARNLCTVVCFGMAYGGAIVLGKTMGSGDMALAERNAKRLAKSTIFSGLAGSIIIFAFYPILPFIAKLSEQAAYYRNILLIINSFSIFGAAINTVYICGIFRSGGDSRFGFFVDTFTMWGLSVPLGIIVAFVLKLPPLAVYAIMYLDEFEKIPAVLIHYKRKKWLCNITRENLELTK
ncbi:MAG: MATE family efflux transporter [Treponema sp.]|nr:MATE family efflux transporter [Treponema sp.]